MSADPYRASAEAHRLSAVIPHEWERIDQGERHCLHCPATSDYPIVSCVPQNPVAKLSDNVTVRREIDAIARQLHGLTERLKRLKATV